VSARKKKKAMTDEELQKLLGEMPPPTWDQIQALRKVLRSQTRQHALVQIVRAMPEGSESSGTSLVPRGKPERCSGPSSPTIVRSPHLRGL
jgi:hypothetical protein